MLTLKVNNQCVLTLKVNNQCVNFDAYRIVSIVTAQTFTKVGKLLHIINMAVIIS